MVNNDSKYKLYTKKQLINLLYELNFMDLTG